jgi:hypothetical protein
VSLSTSTFEDTVSYGGTRWAADSLRWEALRDSCWTFDSGVGSSINFGQNPSKPFGYHQTFEGWSGLDLTLSSLPYFRRSMTCAIDGIYSLWAGSTEAEADGLCWAAGQGYGNTWHLVAEKCFTYPRSGTIALEYDFAVDAEPIFDHMRVLVDTTGDGTGEIEPISYTGVASGHETLPLVRGTTLPSGAASPFCLRFVAESDGSYSDEDGLYPTACGHSAVDNIRLSGAVSDFTDFEAGDNGWTQLQTTGVGDF